MGQSVFAIGNPFGLDNTVTSGIVSAKDRQIGAGPYDHFIQTDASINPGNSGGPLVNLQGEVVGINTAIFSQSGGNIGIGFAIPINLVKDLLPQLKTGGKITRGWLGVSIQGITPDLAASLGLAQAKGALVSSVVQNSPADQAGIRTGDVIVGYAGKPINNASDLPFLVAGTPVGQTVSLQVFRRNQETPVTVAIGRMKEEEVIASPTEKDDLGLTVEQITPDIAEDFGLEQTHGVVITAVAPDGLGDEAGFQPGDIVREINRQPVRNLSDYRNIMASATRARASSSWCNAKIARSSSHCGKKNSDAGRYRLPELLVIFIIVLVLLARKASDVGKRSEKHFGLKALNEPDNTIAERSNKKMRSHPAQ